MKITYETHYKSKRADGRHISSMAAHMAYLRDLKPELAFSESFNRDEFEVWRKKVKTKVKDLLCMPEFTEQPDPTMLNRVKRDGYTVERWEFYPDDYSAVPFLMLIPDGVSAENKAPGVMCFPGSVYSKEFIAGEPLIDNIQCNFEKYPERNKIALYMVKAGYVAFAFDPVCIAELSLETEKKVDVRSQLCHGYIQSGLCYPGVSVFHKLVFMKFLKKLDFVDQSRIGVASHSLGATDAVLLSVLCDDIKAIVFNDYICDFRHTYYSITEYEETQMCNNIGNWHEIPGLYRYFSRPDLLSALAPRYLALTEGGAEMFLDKIRSAYKLHGAEDNLLITYYPKYKDEKDRSEVYNLPNFGLDQEEYFKMHSVDAPDHSFRKDTAIDFLKRVFG